MLIIRTMKSAAPNSSAMVKTDMMARPGAELGWYGSLPEAQPADGAFR